MTVEECRCEWTFNRGPRRELAKINPACPRHGDGSPMADRFRRRMLRTLKTEAKAKP